MSVSCVRVGLSGLLAVDIGRVGGIRPKLPR